MKEIKKYFNKNNLLVFLLVFLILVFGIPIIINELYKLDKGYITLWSAADVLSFYAVILSGIITIGVFVFTIYFSKKDTEKQLKFYLSQTNVPFFVVENISSNSEKDLYIKTKENLWKKDIFIKDNTLALKNSDDDTVVFYVNNIGDGLALNFNVEEKDKLLTLNNSSPIAKQNEIFIFEIKTVDLLKNIDQKDGLYEIVFSYKNASGIVFTQSIRIKITNDIDNNKFSIEISNTSQRKNKIIVI